MKELLNFLIEIGKLKKMPRRGWVINQIKNPESIADHIFRSTIMGWVLAKKKKGLNIEKVLKIALVRDFCKIYAGDITPYDSVLPKGKKELKELMKIWPPRLSSSKKRKIALKKYKKEAGALKKIIFKLPPNLKKEIRNLWLDYEKGLTPEGKFFSQADRMENFLQAYEYWGKYKNPPLGPWRAWAREFFDDPTLLEFMKVLEKKFHRKKIPNKLKPSLVLLDFFSEIGKLKGKKRRGWLVHQIKDSESTASHIFRVAILAWLLGEKKKLNLEKVIKMALTHDLCEVYSPDLTPYDPLLPKNKRKIKEVLKRWPKFTLALKRKRGQDKYKMEFQALNKLILKLPQNLKAEIKNLWLDFEKGLSKEGRFVHRIDKIENFLQGLEYWKKYGKIQHKLWVRWIKEWIDDPLLIKFFRVVDEKFHQKRKIIF